MNAIESRNDAAFISYVYITLRHKATRLAKRWRRKSEREILCVDAPLYHQEDITLGDLLPDTASGVEDQAVFFSEQSWQGVCRTSNLHRAFSQLTPYQREVVMMVICHGLSESDYAVSRNVSQQAVSKTKNKALHHLRRGLEEWKSCGRSPERNKRLRFSNGRQRLSPYPD